MENLHGLGKGPMEKKEINCVLTEGGAGGKAGQSAVGLRAGCGKERSEGNVCFREGAGISLGGGGGVDRGKKVSRS